MKKHTVVCLSCGRQFDANRRGTKYYPQKQRYECPECAKAKSQKAVSQQKAQKSKSPWLKWWIAAVVFLYVAFRSLAEDVSAAFVALVIALVCAFFGWRSYQKFHKAAAEAERQQAEAAAREQQQKAEAAERQRLFNKKHGKLFCTVAGVTFDNDGGIVNDPDEDGEVTLEPYEYKGSPAIYVLYDGRCVGNIRRCDVQSVLQIRDKIEFIELQAESFKNDDGEKLYRADVLIQYAKS